MRSFLLPLLLAWADRTDGGAGPPSPRRRFLPPPPRPRRPRRRRRRRRCPPGPVGPIRSRKPNPEHKPNPSIL
eukprot:8299356-Pyramimonas_sp.AAC.1